MLQSSSSHRRYRTMSRCIYVTLVPVPIANLQSYHNYASKAHRLYWLLSLHFINDLSFTGANDFSTVFCPPVPNVFLPDVSQYCEVLTAVNPQFFVFWDDRFRGNFYFCLKGRIMKWWVPVCWCYIEWLLCAGLLCEVLDSWVVTPWRGHHLPLARSQPWFLVSLPYICIAPSYVAAE
jgi:hypothetical protein